jgi:hypothetical protein
VDFLLDVLLQGSERDAILAELAADPGARRSVELTEEEQILAPNRTDSYQRSFDRARSLRDAAALSTALERLRGAKNLDTSDTETARARWISGEVDDQLLEGVEATLVKTAELIERTKLDARTRAAAHLLSATAQAKRAILKGDAEAAAQARADVVTARGLWPALQVNAWLTTAVLDEAGIRADSARWTKERRVREGIAILSRWAAAGDPLADQVRASPHWGVLVEAAKTDPRPPNLDDWRLAQLIGDAALIERTQAALTDPQVRMRLEANAILDPADETIAEDLALLKPR